MDVNLQILVNFGQNPVQSMTTHIQQVILDQVNLNMATFRNTDQLQVVGYAISSLVIDRPEPLGEEETVQDHQMMPSSDDESKSSDESISSDGSSLMFSSGFDSGPHHPDME